MTPLDHPDTTTDLDLHVSEEPPTCRHAVIAENWRGLIAIWWSGNRNKRGPCGNPITHAYTGTCRHGEATWPHNGTLCHHHAAIYVRESAGQGLRCDKHDPAILRADKVWAI